MDDYIREQGTSLVKFIVTDAEGATNTAQTIPVTDRAGLGQRIAVVILAAAILITAGLVVGKMRYRDFIQPR